MILDAQTPFFSEKWSFLRETWRVSYGFQHEDAQGTNSLLCYKLEEAQANSLCYKLEEAQANSLCYKLEEAQETNGLLCYKLKEAQETNGLLCYKEATWVIYSLSRKPYLLFDIIQ